MKMKWRALYKDLIGVLRKHFRPLVEKETLEVLLIRQIKNIQGHQKELDALRSDLASIAAQTKNDEIFQELDRLAGMAPKQKTEAFDRKDFDGHDDDFMFI